MPAGDRAATYSTFHVGANYFGIDVREVEEVLAHPPTTPVPLTGEEVRGLINLRGRIVTAVDLRRRLGLRPVDDDREPFVVVVRTPTGPLGLVVDEIDDVVVVDTDALEPPPTRRGEARELVTGVHLLEHRLLQVLDVERLVAVVAA